ncbi:expressed unknown protein [Seminavis robusta]|uniref:Uncharacterized protein n=1 Tax=Seminavis robusta TaxID=568900 RepID=A0A9N8E3V1_9STRA|nr:expressed unknown protein [Seminavis robusta]|eukprot:Sro525_g160190.1 n/a (244) ;mRNA; f:48810-49541
MTSTQEPTSSQVIDHIMQLNNAGIQMLQDHRYEGAISTLSKAVSTFKMSLDLLDGNDGCCSNPGCDLSFTFQLSNAAVRAAESGGDEFSSAPSFIFDSPIRVAHCLTNVDQFDIKSSTQDQLKMFSFALVFNWALAFHLAAPQGNTVKEHRRLTKALAFYKLALNMIENENLNLGIMEALAVINNQAQVYLKLGDRNHADQCYDQVRSDIMLVADCGRQQDILLFEQFFAAAVFEPSKFAPAA